MTIVRANSDRAPRALIVAEEGGVIVMIAIFLPVFVLVVGFVIDIGNWFVHKRHLQTQADAAALAGAAEFASCFGDEAAANDTIAATARHYSGDEAGGYNLQLGGTAPDEVHFVLNSSQYHENSGPVDTTVVEEPPCAAGMVDVKMTETDLPLFLQIAGLFSSVDHINTHARVEIFQQDFVSGALPVAVPDPNPRVARVYFVDETSGTVLGSRELTRIGEQNGLAVWDNEADPFPLTMDSDRVGVRVAFGGATSTTCGDPLVECYDSADPNLGLLHVRGYSGDGSGAQPNPPIARHVFLTPGSCLDPYFAESATACTIGVQAEVDFGPCTGGLAAADAAVSAVVSGSTQPLSLVSCAGSTWTWATTGTPFSIPAAAGPVPVELKWEETTGTVGAESCRTGGGNKCKGSFGVVQRSYAATEDRSGPLRFAQLWEGGTAWANSLETCSAVQPDCTYDVVAKIGTDLNLAENASSVDDPIVTLRFGANSGSQNQALDCDPALANLRDEIAGGCAPKYARNQGTACPAGANELWNLAQPWDCVAVQTGDATGQIWQGMNLRVHGDESPSECVSPNHWPDFPDLDPDDPRIVPVFITPFGAFEGSGSGTVPVTDFAVFYTTGWHGSQGTCPDDDPSPQKSMVGHFIKYVQAFNDGSAGEERCDANELGSCVAVMTE